MNEPRRITLSIKLLACTHKIRELLDRIKEVENSRDMINVKNNQIKMIKIEIINLGEEIDNLKKEVMLLTAYNIN